MDDHLQLFKKNSDRKWKNWEIKIENDNVKNAKNILDNYKILEYFDTSDIVIPNFDLDIRYSMTIPQKKSTSPMCYSLIF